MSSCTSLQVYRTNRFHVVGSVKDAQSQQQLNDKCIGRNRRATTTIFPLLHDEQHQQQQQRQHQHGIFLDINEPYTRDVILNAFSHPSRRSAFTITLGPGEGMEPITMPPPCVFQWAEYERVDWDAVLAGRHGASSYCIRKGVSRKAQLAHYTHRYICKHPDSCLRHAIPETVILDTWSVWEEDGDNGHYLSATTSASGTAAAAAARGPRRGLGDIIASVGDPSTGCAQNRKETLENCLAEAHVAMERAEESYQQRQSDATAAEPPVWILKGSTVNKGVGIYIVHLYEQLVDICWSESDIREWVLQKYISRPLLLRKRKFHIRAYVVAVSSIQVYLSRESLALCAGTPYRRHETDNLFAHLTNTAYQDQDRNFVEESCVLRWNESDISPLLILSGSCENNEDARCKIQQVIQDMERITGELFRAYENEFGVFSPIEGCFEQYGLDFLVDEDWNVVLLEVNPGPDFKQTGDRLQVVIENLMGSTVDLLKKILDKEAAAPLQVGNLALVYQSERGTGRRKGGADRGIRMTLDD